MDNDPHADFLIAETERTQSLAIDEEYARLRAENDALRAANAASVAKAVQSALERQQLAELAQYKAAAARAKALRAAFDALAEVAIAVHALIPDDAKRDHDGDPIVACGLTQPQLIRALAELAREPG